VIGLVDKKGRTKAIYKALGSTKTLMDDFVFNRFGFEARDIENGIEQLDLLDDKEFIAIKMDASKERLDDLKKLDKKVSNRLIKYVKRTAKFFGLSLDYRNSFDKDTMDTI